RRRASDGDPAAVSARRARWARRALQERASLSRAALWHPERRGSGAGGELLGKEIGVPALLALDEVHGAYGPSRVLHGVSLEARAGEVVSLLGRNGAGKSTTLKAIDRKSVG